MLDQESIRPVIIAMSLYIIIASIIPHFVTKPSGIGFIDDIVMTFIAQKGSMMSGTVVTGIIVLATNYIQEKFF